MNAARRFRTMLLVSAGALAACQTQLPRSLTVLTGEPSKITLTMKSGLTLSLRNASAAPPAEVYSNADDRMLKVVPDAEMQVLFDLFTAQQLFALGMPNVPGDARDVVRLEHGGRTWIWARRGSYTDPKEAAFQQVYGYFMALYNGNQAYHTDDRRGFDAVKEETRRKTDAVRNRHDVESGDGGGRR